MSAIIKLGIILLGIWIVFRIATSGTRTLPPPNTPNDTASLGS